MLLVVTFTILCVGPSEGEELPCPRVQTSGHGLLDAFRVEDEGPRHKKKCLGELRLLDPVTMGTWCLAKGGGRTETLECADRGGHIRGGNGSDSDTTTSTTTSTSTTTTTTTTTTATDLKNNFVKQNQDEDITNNTYLQYLEKGVIIFIP